MYYRGAVDITPSLEGQILKNLKRGMNMHFQAKPVNIYNS